jgi:hypothetical protein
MTPGEQVKRIYAAGLQWYSSSSDNSITLLFHIGMQHQTSDMSRFKKAKLRPEGLNKFILEDLDYLIIHIL